MDKPLWMWALFIGIVILLLIVDLGVFNKKDHVIGVRESLITSAFYITLGFLFGGFVWYQMGLTSAELYWTGFLVEKTLALDNIFVISLVFSYFAVPRLYQHRVLFWGILGVIVLRGIMIGLGAKIVAEFSWVLYLFAAFLMFTGVKMLFSKKDDKPDIAKNPAVLWLKKRLKVTHEIHGNKFFVTTPNARGKMVRHATPLFLALVVVEVVDLIFAVDSIPAIFAITTDPYIIYTSNIFAILGLRALYFALDAVLYRFEYLKYALALVLIFIGGKVFVADAMDLEKFPAEWSLGITVFLIAGGVIFSLFKTRGQGIQR